MADTTAQQAAPAPGSDAITTPKLPELQALKEDDEFEEFAAEDWDSSETYGAALDKDKAASAKGAGLDSLWEDSWDDDEIEDDFSRQLRGELQKQEHAMQS